MAEGIFRSEDLKLCDWDYVIRHRQATNFKKGTLVFLKCNPEVPMLVIKIDKKENRVITQWLNKDGEKETQSWKPETILQYKYAGLVKYKDGKTIISLN